MSKNLRSLILFSFLLGPAFLPEARALRDNYATCWVENKALHTLWRKAGRGITNMGLGWMEIIYQPVYMYEDGNRLPIAVTGGILKGVFYGIARTLIGVYEFVTFPVDIPEGYKPVMLPESPVPRYCRKLTEL